MKVFDFTSGTKGQLLGEVTRVSAIGGWLVTKGEKVFKVTFSAEGKPRIKGANYEWTSCASYPEWVDDKRTGKMISIKPEDFGVGAICFCQGQDRGTETWRWYVIGTDEWNRAACVRGQLKAVFSHMLNAPEEESEDVFA